MSHADATVIARHATIKGDLKLDGPAVISGRIEGSIIAVEVEIAPDGIIEGDIHAAVIDIHGSVNGNITATRACRLGATANVQSQLRAANLSIAEGATFVGQVVVGAAASATSAPEIEENEAAREDAAAISSVSRTINRIEALAAEVDNTLHTMNIAAPPPGPSAGAAIAATVAAPAAGSPVVTQGPEIRVFPQSVQTMQRAPRIIKAR
jgi:cytoskeletal protein CcmA (bactofilin family)